MLLIRAERTEGNAIYLTGISAVFTHKDAPVNVDILHKSFI